MPIASRIQATLPSSRASATCREARPTDRASSPEEPGVLSKTWGGSRPRAGEEAMNQIVNPHNAFLETSTKAALGRWDDLLRLQVDLFFPQESAYLKTFEPW